MGLVEDWNLAEALAWLGYAELEAGDSRAAPHLLRSIGIIEDHGYGGFHYFSPMAKFALARVLLESDRPRARRFAEQARDGYRQLGKYRDADRQLVERWLEQH